MNSMIRSTKKILAVVLAAAMIAAFLPMTQESAYAAKAKKPAQVKGLKVSVAEDNQVTVTWKKAKNAKKYNVSIKDGSSKLTSVKSSKKLKLTFQGGSAVKYTIKVQGINGKKKGAFSKAVTKKTNEVVSAAVQKALDDAKEAQAKAEEAQKAAEAALKEAEEAKTAAEQRAIAAEAELEQLKKEKADKEAAAAVVDAWADVPEITVDSSEEDLSKAKAVIAAYDELTDEQKALLPEDVKAGIEAAKEVIAKIKEEAAELDEIKAAIKGIEANSTSTFKIDEKDFYVISKTDEKAVIMLKNGMIDLSFDTNGGYDWAQSSLYAYLNSTYLESMPTLAKLADETEYPYSLTDYSDEDDPTVLTKSVMGKVSILTESEWKDLSSDLQSSIADGNSNAIWNSDGAFFYDPDDGYFGCGVHSSTISAGQTDWDSTVTTTSYGEGWIPIKTNPIVTVSLD